MLIKIGSFELEVRRRSLYLGINLGMRWRYQTFRDFSGAGITTSDWTDRKTGRVRTKGPLVDPEGAGS
ncbi:hypothetical protein PZN02_000977 [Sinorhizobium garamanticum]|uniref:Uncharacterized protein n=1 Tax=Sinorhizobium garamanticum TaxID=680247 RepID=A0ABY8DDX2_9HYPH|nr:hypothetical protein [Sinorhizobium garamanticum]WEX88492.1 hypothetical protein PZN02_000977 [Sinorhizobium garamanticum]